MKAIIWCICFSVVSLNCFGERYQGIYIGSFQTQDYNVRLVSVDNDIKYEVRSLAEKQLTGLVTQAELVKRFPELEDLVKTGIADHAGLYQIAVPAFEFQY